MARRTTTVALVLLAHTGCSFVAVTRPGLETPHKEPVRCTTTYAPPIVDSLLAAVAGVGVVRAAAPGDTNESKGTNTMIGLAVAITTIASASAGYLWVGRCRAQVAEQASMGIFPPPAPQSAPTMTRRPAYLDRSHAVTPPAAGATTAPGPQAGEGTAAPGPVRR